MHVDFNETRFLVPYAGIATGYEWFLLKANDYRTGEIGLGEYANWAWESWGGLGMRLGKDLRVDTELFYNGGSLEREVSDSSGQSWREAVHANGVGARVGGITPVLEMPRIVGVRAMRSIHTRARAFASRSARTVHVPERGCARAHAQSGRNLWSIQLHGGSFAPLEANGMSPMLGMRYCKHYSPYLQAGC
jgi:hypothetical protein